MCSFGANVWTIPPLRRAVGRARLQGFPITLELHRADSGGSQSRVSAAVQ
jgi:hypothetical protein